MKASALNNKASDLSKNDIEESINLINKAIEIEPGEDIFKKIYMINFLNYLQKNN